MLTEQFLPSGPYRKESSSERAQSINLLSVPHASLALMALISYVRQP